MDAHSSQSPLHVVIFPWLAFGHLLPGLDLAERLAARGHRVSFVSTPCNIARLPPVRPALAGLVDLVALPLPRIDGLPDGAEATSDIPFEKFELHRKAFDGLAAPFSAFLDGACTGGKRPDWVFADFVHHWVAAAAQERGVPCAMILPCSAAVMASAALPTESSTDQREAIAQSMGTAVPSFEAKRATEEFATEGASGVSIMTRFSLTLKRSNLIAMPSCPELEPGAFTILTSFYGKPVVPCGLLPPRPDGARGISKNGEHDAILQWLDEQPAKSVVYVALGSEAPMSEDLLCELAHGLDLAGTRFLWTMRKPAGVDGDSVLPEGFLDRTGERGLVTTRWAPQVSILAHAAVCTFLTHCGWGSLVEALQFGHPLIMLPIFGNQGPNARILEGRKLGVAVPRNDKDGSFDRGGVARAARAVVVEEEGKAFAANARKLQEIVADREREERCIDEFFQHLTSWNELKNNSTTKIRSRVYCAR